MGIGNRTLILRKNSWCSTLLSPLSSPHPLSFLYLHSVLLSVFLSVSSSLSHHFPLYLGLHISPFSSIPLQPVPAVCAPTGTCHLYARLHPYLHHLHHPQLYLPHLHHLQLHLYHLCLHCPSFCHVRMHGEHGCLRTTTRAGNNSPPGLFFCNSLG